MWTWNDVLEEADKAVAKYEDAGKGVRGSVRKLFRHLGDNEPSYGPWLDLIPQDNYSGTLNGGLKLLFAVSTCSTGSLKCACELTSVGCEACG